MSGTVPVKSIAGIFGIAGFSIALIAGLAAGNDAKRVLITAIVCLIVCNLVGVLAGAILDRVVREHLATSAESASSTTPENVSSSS